MLFCHLAWRFVYASSSFPSIFLSFPLRLDRERVALSPPLATFGVSFFFFFFTMEEDRRRRRRKGVGRSMSIFFFIFSIPPLTSGG